jgi:hypothetical protein
MPSYAQSTPHPLPWTVPMAQGALEAAAWMMVAATRVLREVYRRLERPVDLADRQEHRLPYDQATEILATIECTLEDHLWPAVKTLRRSSRITDSELLTEFEVEKEGRRDFGLEDRG